MQRPNLLDDARLDLGHRHRHAAGCPGRRLSDVPELDRSSLQRRALDLNRLDNTRDRAAAGSIATAAVRADPIEAWYSGGVALDHVDPCNVLGSIGLGGVVWEMRVSDPRRLCLVFVDSNRHRGREGTSDQSRSETQRSVCRPFGGGDPTRAMWLRRGHAGAGSRLIEAAPATVPQASRSTRPSSDRRRCMKASARPSGLGRCRWR